MHVKVKDLPDVLRAALASVGYAKVDVAIRIAPTESIQSFGHDGMRSFACIVNMSSGEYRTTYGSWGGPNAYALSNAVDRDDRKHTIPANGAVITGHEGGARPVSAGITISAANVVPCLPSAPALSDDEKQVLAIFRSIKSSYRKDYLRGKDMQIEALIAKGFLKRNAKGATAITTEGKNACEGVNV